MSVVCEDEHSSTSAQVDIAIDNNGTWSDAFQFGTEGDTTWDLNNQTFECDVQRNAYDVVPMLSLSSANGRIMIDDVIQRVIHFNVAPAIIQAALSPGVYVYDLVMVDGATSVRVPLMHGRLTVTQGVTYPP
jgi:hypothetical protein